MNNLKDILDRLNSVEEKNGVYWANCPCHNDMVAHNSARYFFFATICRRGGELWIDRT